MNKKKTCPNCYWLNNCSLFDNEKKCKSFTTKKELIEKGYLPNEEK